MGVNAGLASVHAVAGPVPTTRNQSCDRGLQDRFVGITVPGPRATHLSEQLQSLLSRLQ